MSRILTFVLSSLFFFYVDDVSSKPQSVKGPSGNLNPRSRRRLSSFYDSDDDDISYNDQKLIVFFDENCVSNKEEAQVKRLK